MDVGAQGLEPLLGTFPGHKQGIGSEEHLGHEPQPVWDAGVTDGGLVYYATALAAISAFSRKLIRFSIVAVPICVHPKVHWSSPLSTCLLAFVIFSLLDNGPPHGDEIIFISMLTANALLLCFSQVFSLTMPSACSKIFHYHPHHCRINLKVNKKSNKKLH